MTQRIVTRAWAAIIGSATGGGASALATSSLNGDLNTDSGNAAALATAGDALGGGGGSNLTGSSANGGSAAGGGASAVASSTVMGSGNDPSGNAIAIVVAGDGQGGDGGLDLTGSSADGGSGDPGPGKRHVEPVIVLTNLCNALHEIVEADDLKDEEKPEIEALIRELGGL